MKLELIIGVLILTGLLTIAASQAGAKDHGKHLTNDRGGRAAARMSSNATANHNAQWAADPSRGWVRAEERHELRQSSRAAKLKSNNGKAKAKSKGY